jgi:hypothetical protein
MPGPDIWGPPGWKFIHYVTMGYPNNPSEETKRKYYNYFHALKHVIPCGICASHFTEHLEKLPLTDEVLSSKENLMKWGIDMHNFVNKMNKKKEYNYAEAMLLIMGGFENIGITTPTKLPEPEIKIVEKFVETTNIYPLLISVFIIIILLAIIVIKVRI